MWCDLKLDKRIFFWSYFKSRWTEAILCYLLPPLEQERRKKPSCLRAGTITLFLHASHFSHLEIHFQYWSPAPSKAADDSHVFVLISFHTLSNALWIPTKNKERYSERKKIPYCISEFTPLRNDNTQSSYCNIRSCLAVKEDKPPLMPHSISTRSSQTLQSMRSLFNQGSACKPIKISSHTLENETL